MTKLIKINIKDWDSIIPYSITIDISVLTDDDIIDLINNSPLYFLGCF